MYRCMLRMRLNSNVHHGKGNRAKRRLGQYVHDPTRPHPKGMSAKELAQFMRTNPK